MNDIFESSVRSTGDMAGVFESDGEVAYFYLYIVGGQEGKKIVGAIRIPLDVNSYSESDIDIFWSEDERSVHLRILGKECASFDCRNVEDNQENRGG